MPRARDLGIEIGVAARPVRPTPCSTSPASGSGTPRSAATSRHRPRAAASRAPASPRWCSPRTPTRGRCRPAAPCSTAPASAPASSPPPSGASAETPVYLTSTMQLGRVYDAACEIELERAPRGRRRRRDPGGRRVRRLVPQRLPPDAGRAPTTCARRTTRRWRRAASATPPDEGAVGAGTGMSCLGFKGGIGTSSRVTAGRPHRRGAADDQLRRARAADRRRRAGRPAAAAGADAGAAEAGRLVHRHRGHRRAGRRRVAARGWPAGSGSAWPATGSVAHHGSGEIFLAPRHRPARSTATASPTADRASPAAGSTPCSRRSSTPPRRRCSTRCSASPTTVGRDGNTSEGLDPDGRARLLEEAGRAGH